MTDVSQNEEFHQHCEYLNDSVVWHCEAQCLVAGLCVCTWGACHQMTCCSWVLTVPNAHCEEELYSTWDVGAHLM